VIGAAPTGRAARQLREVAQIPAGTMHALAGELERTTGFPPRTVLVLDEAGMAPTRLTAALFAHAEKAGAKAIAVGDPGQLGSVEAGGWLAAISRRQPGPALREVVRQRDHQERAALEALHDGDPSHYLAHKRDAITVHGTEAAALQTLVEQWHRARLEHGPGKAVMIARDNRTRELLNQAARERLRSTGALPPRETPIGRRGYAPGDRVITRRNDRRLDVDNGTISTVVEADVYGMRLRTDSGERRWLGRDYVAEHVEHAYAVTAHGAQGATFTWAGVIGRPEEFTREWAYTALSRAREQTVLHVVAGRAGRERERERDDYGPAMANRTSQGALQVLRRAMRHNETERLAMEQHQPDTEFHRSLSETEATRQRELQRLADLDMRAALSAPLPSQFRRPPSRWPAHRVPRPGRIIAR
jgi:ATP-dependent exoDNAse (exonuclease V) alpha subunit